MRVYHPGAKGRQSIFVRPGIEYPNSDFVDANGNAKQFQVWFVDGVAEVADNLGQYMIEHDLASRWSFLLPKPLKAIETKLRRVA
jgi:hypothetical protein